MHKFLVAVSVLTAGFLMASCGEEKLSDNPVERSMQIRHRSFEDMGDLFKTMDDELKKSSPDTKKVLDAAKKIETMGKEIPSWFPAGTGPESGFKTYAKADIWTDNARFMKMHEEFMAEATKLVHAASGDNPADTMSQYFTMGVACANCHKPFRTEIPGEKK